MIFSPEYKKLVAPFKVDKPVEKRQRDCCSLLNLLELTGQEENLKQEQRFFSMPVYLYSHLQWLICFKVML